MPKPYSYDLRQKVIQSIKLDGLNKSEASQVFIPLLSLSEIRSNKKPDYPSGKKG
jgi:transposase